MAVPSKVITATRWGAGGLLKVIFKYWYWIIFLFILIPLFISSIRTAKETNNPIYPVIDLGLHITNADAVIYNDVQTLKEDPIKIIGMEKPDKGLWKTFVYYWFLFLLLWRFLGNIWLISFPFVIIYKWFRLKGTKGIASSASGNFMATVFYGFLLMLFINMLIIIVKMASGEVDFVFPENADVYKKAWSLFVLVIPFHGLGSLFMYILNYLKLV